MPNAQQGKSVILRVACARPHRLYVFQDAADRAVNNRCVDKVRELTRRPALETAPVFDREPLAQSI